MIRLLVQEYTKVGKLLKQFFLLYLSLITPINRGVSLCKMKEDFANEERLTSIFRYVIKLKDKQGRLEGYIMLLHLNLYFSLPYALCPLRLNTTAVASSFHFSLLPNSSAAWNIAFNIPSELRF